MKDTDKVTLTFGQLKKLFEESKQSKVRTITKWANVQDFFRWFLDRPLQRVTSNQLKKIFPNQVKNNFKNNADNLKLFLIKNKLKFIKFVQKDLDPDVVIDFEIDNIPFTCTTGDFYGVDPDFIEDEYDDVKQELEKLKPKPGQTVSEEMTVNEFFEELYNVTPSDILSDKDEYETFEDDLSMPGSADLRKIIKTQFNGSLKDMLKFFRQNGRKKVKVFQKMNPTIKPIWFELNGQKFNFKAIESIF